MKETLISRLITGAILVVTLLLIYHLQIPNTLLRAILFSAISYDIAHLIQSVDLKKKKIKIVYILFLFIYSFYSTNIILRYYSSRQNKNIALKIISAVTLSDTIQYFSGRYFGRIKFGCGPSPNKTLEGYLGAIVITPILYSHWSNYSDILFLVFTGFLGDTFESILKRLLNVKDTSNLLGSHGGWIDRLDGIFMSFIFYDAVYG